MSASGLKSGGPILLFDGECSVCNRAVHFVLARDRKAIFRFAALQSEVGIALATDRGVDPRRLDSMVLVVGERAYQKSSAALQVAARLGWPWKLAAVGWLVPRFVRDAAYDWFAARRHRFFPSPDACLRPTGALRERFLDL